MSIVKNKKGITAGVLMLCLCLFEIGTVTGLFKDIAADSSYAGDLAVEIFYLAGIIGAALTLILGKAGKGSVAFLALSSGVCLYRAASYICLIMGNAMKLSLVIGNVIAMCELVFFATPLAVMILSKNSLGEKKVKGFLIAELCAFAVCVAGIITFFVGYGKNVFLNADLLFQVYGADLSRHVVLLCAFAVAVISLRPAAPSKKAKKRR